MHPLKKAARVAGAIYLSLVLIAPFAMLYVPGKLIVRGNATATADNILAHETMFRLSIFGDLIGHVIFICLAIALYRLLSSVNNTWALLMVSFVLVSAAVGFLNALNNIAAVILFRGAEFLSVFDKPQRDALAMLFVRLHTQGEFISEIFWGVWLFPFGLLVFRSGFLPRLLGVWLIIACFAWIALTITAQFFPYNYETLFAWLQPAFFAEMAIMLWLLIRGANVAPVPVATSLSNFGLQALRNHDAESQRMVTEAQAEGIEHSNSDRVDRAGVKAAKSVAMRLPLFI
jgi:hypothetical protein